MITELYTFSTSSFVVADEWNANFNVLYNENIAHQEAIVDAQNSIAFPDSDVTDLVNAVRSQLNSFIIPGTSIVVSPECEYYKVLANGEDLVINIPDNFDSECRILIQIQNTRTLMPFSINYNGITKINYGYYDYKYFRSGYYYIMIYETNGLAQVKLIWTGV